MAQLTIKDIARICQVSISTVSRAINDDPTINPVTRERILKVVREYHYVPNNSARQLKMTESNTIALVIKGIHNPFFLSMLPVFEDELQEKGYEFFLHAVGEDQDEYQAGVRLAKEKRLKGIIFLGGKTSDPEAALGQLDIPHVLCSVAIDTQSRTADCPAVSIDDEKEAFRMVDYLCGMGHRRIAIITGKASDRTVGLLRLEGYRRALAAHDIPFDPGLVCHMEENLPEYSEENGYVTAGKLLKSGKDFTALFVISDRTAIGVYKAIYDAGKRIPEDYSVAGFDGISICRYMYPALTTMVQPVEKMVRSSIELLMAQIRGERAEGQQIYEAALEERESVRKA